jgi:hypothetical protein
LAIELLLVVGTPVGISLLFSGIARVTPLTRRTACQEETGRIAPLECEGYDGILVTAVGSGTVTCTAFEATGRYR